MADLFYKKWNYFIRLLAFFLMTSIIFGQRFDPLSEDNDSFDSDTAKIKQSNECTTEEIDNNIQCFQEIPKGEYEVAQGSAATLRCVVRNQHGKVQWRAVPVLLGYDRNIPGRPRYRVVGSVVKGEHFLEIRNVKKEDAGIYECQVQPVGQLHPLLRRKTKLVVLIKPSQPQIFYREVRPVNDQVIINSINQTMRSELFCYSHDGEPKVKFQWFLNNKEKINDQSTFVEETSSTKSKLSLLTSTLKDGDVIRCRVSNRATEVHQDPDRQHFQTEVVVVIHNPPGQPEITEITPSANLTFVEGDVIRATCSSSPPGKPSGNLVWRWKFAKVRELYNNQREQFTTKDISPQYYQQIISRTNLISKLELPPITSQYHGAQLFCIATNPVISYQSAAKKLRVKYPPSAVTISSPDSSIVSVNIGTEGLTENVVYAEAGEEKILTCSTMAFYSEASIKWQFHHNPLTNDVFRQRFSIDPVEKVWNEGESFHRNSTIKIIINKQFDKSYLDCQAWSGGKRVDTRVKLHITYPPEKPIITGYHVGTKIRLDHVLELTCSTIGGNPYPDLHWYRDNKKIDSTFISQQVGNQKSLKIKLSPTIDDNNVKYFCQARSAPLKNSPLNSDEITLTVLFPPTTINLKSLSGHEIESGNILTLQCAAGESNPPALVRWKINRCGQMMSELGRRPLQTNCVEETISATSSTITPGKYGGSFVKSNLEFRTNWRDHLDYIDCEIFNQDYGEDHQMLRKRIQINVTFAPQFDGIVNKLFLVEEGQTQTLNLEPIANPAVQQYNWFKNSVPLDSGQRSKSILIDKAKLTITNADPGDMGNYTLVVANGRGESRITIYLNVTYQPRLIGDRTEVIINNRQNADLECSAKANPANPHLSFKWIRLDPANGRDDFSSGNLVPSEPIGCNQAKWKGAQEKSGFKLFSKCNSKSQFEMNSLLIVYEVDRNDVTYYKCIINNGVGQDVVRMIELIKYFTPQILIVPQYAKVGGELGKSASLFCHIKAEPQPNVSWFFGRYNSSITDNSKYRRNITKIRPGFYIAHLKILDLQRSDHGTYMCKAENEKGSDSRKIHVSGTSVPDIPLELQAVNKTQNTIELSWIQGFDGGSSQTFQVRWRINSANSLYRYEDIASEKTKTSLTYILSGLQSDTVYLISINSRNPQHGTSAFSKEITVSTNAVTHIEPDPGQGLFPIIQTNKLQDNTILFIVAASVFGFVILVVNILVIIFVLRKRRQRSRTAKLEARYNNPKALHAASNGLILSRDDSMKDSNFNYLRSDMVELYPRGLDSSQLLHPNPHQMHSLRRSIPDDQKTFSSFETGSDDAREDLLRRQKEFGCCGIDPNSQKGSIIVAYDPITNASYYAPVAASSTPIYLQQGMYDQDTMSTLLSPIHEGGQRQLMTFMNMIPINGQRNSSSCGSIHSGGNYSNNPQQVMTSNISPAGSVVASDTNNRNNGFSDNSNCHSGPLNGGNDHNSNSASHLNTFNNNPNAPYRTRVVSPTLMSYNIAPQHREAYANELRKAQLSGNIMVNPAMFNRSLTTSPHQMAVNPPLFSPHQISYTGQSISMPVSYENMSANSNAMNNSSGTLRSNDSQFNSLLVPTALEGKVSQKYRCIDNELTSQNQNTDRSIEFVNPAMEDSIHQTNSDSQFLPRPNII